MTKDGDGDDEDNSNNNNNNNNKTTNWKRRAAVQWMAERS